MGRKVFISYSHRLDQDSAYKFKEIFVDQRDVFIDTSIRDNISHLEKDGIKNRLRPLIKNASVTIVLIGKETGRRWWVDWEIYNSLRKSKGNERNGLLGIYIPYKEHCIPKRILDNEHMSLDFLHNH